MSGSIIKQKYVCDSVKSINRSENQDNILVLEHRGFNLYAVFDGVGSAVNAKKATVLAKQFITKNYSAYVSESVNLSRLMYETNKFILNSKVPEALTTYCIVYISNRTNAPITYSSMGDSRMYFKTKQYFEQITIDNKVEGSKNTISKCLGMNYDHEQDFAQFEVEKNNNSLLICTDGFYTFLEDNKLDFFEILSKRSLLAVKENLKMYIRKRNTDDSTYIFIK